MSTSTSTSTSPLIPSEDITKELLKYTPQYIQRWTYNKDDFDKLDSLPILYHKRTYSSDWDTKDLGLSGKSYVYYIRIGNPESHSSDDYTGLIKDGKFHGLGTLTKGNIGTYQGIFVDGVFVKGLDTSSGIDRHVCLPEYETPKEPTWTGTIEFIRDWNYPRDETIEKDLMKKVAELTKGGMGTGTYNTKEPKIDPTINGVYKLDVDNGSREYTGEVENGAPHGIGKLMIKKFYPHNNMYGYVGYFYKGAFVKGMEVDQCGRAVAWECIKEFDRPPQTWIGWTHTEVVQFFQSKIPHLYNLYPGQFAQDLLKYKLDGATLHQMYRREWKALIQDDINLLQLVMVFKDLKMDTNLAKEYTKEGYNYPVKPL